MKYLLDTNICIYIIKKKPEQVFQKLEKLHPDEVGISSITLSELHYGIQKSADPQKNETALARFLTPLQVLDFDASDAIIYGEIRAGLEKAGTPIGPLDTLIGAQAVSKGLILVTNNEKEFQRIPKISLENWSL